MRKNTKGLMQRMKSWLLPGSSRDGTAQPNNGTAVAGFVQRVSSDVDIITSSNMARPLAVLMPPAIAAATPMRTIPLFLVPCAVEPAEVEIVQVQRAQPRLHLVHSAERADISSAAAKPADFHLAARLASVAHLNTVTGRLPTKKATRFGADNRAKHQSQSANRPVVKPAAVSKSQASDKSRRCFVRPQTNGKAVVVTVPQRAKRVA
jgi:hypothetical protein